MYIAIILLGVVGAVAALILFAVSKKFEVHEDPRIGQVFPDVVGLRMPALRPSRSRGCFARSEERM